MHTMELIIIWQSYRLMLVRPRSSSCTRTSVCVCVCMCACGVCGVCAQYMHTRTHTLIMYWHFLVAPQSSGIATTRSRQCAAPLL